MLNDTKVSSENQAKFYTDAAKDVLKKRTLLDENIFRVFISPGEVIETRIFDAFGKSEHWDGYARGIISGYFDNFDDFKKALGPLIDTKLIFYFTLHVVDPRIIGRAFNRLKVLKATTSDNNVLFYKWIPLDFDPIRPTGISSTETELAEALALRDQVHEYLIDTTEYQEIISAVSGNGGHLLIRLPEYLPVNDDSKAFVQGFINNIHEAFSTDSVDIDTTVFNPARIWKLYGTIARKGDEIPANEYREAQKHRLAFIDSMGSLEVN